MSTANCFLKTISVDINNHHSKLTWFVISIMWIFLLLTLYDLPEPQFRLRASFDVGNTVQKVNCSKIRSPSRSQSPSSREGPGQKEPF